MSLYDLRFPMPHPTVGVQEVRESIGHTVVLLILDSFLHAKHRIRNGLLT